MNRQEKYDYTRIVYNKSDIPITSYPKKLINYIIKKFDLKPEQELLELGPGRGDFLKEFSNNKFKISAVDVSDYVKEYCPDVTFKYSDLEKDNIPFKDEQFDIIYSKSFVEHFYYPEKVFKEIFRVLKPGGRVITLTPHWKYMFKNFYEDYSHRTPFTKESLNYIQKVNGFKNIKTINFRQLPALWKFKSLILFSEITRILAPSFFFNKFKWVRFSKEVMLLSISQKPKK
jgi:ubiquinone/menaquinone biosynthesis C-methylase UbiE